MLNKKKKKKKSSKKGYKMMIKVNKVKQL